jgi:hypothetical protein
MFCSQPVDTQPQGLSFSIGLRGVGSSPPTLVPTQHPQRTERVPATRLTHRFVERKGKRFVVRALEEPSAVSLAPALDEMHCVADARIGLDIGVP